MQLGETIATYAVDLALRGETGKFEVRSPDGETHYVTCRWNHAVAKAGQATDQTYPRAFLIRKVAELVTTDESTDTQSTAMPVETLPSPPHAPFLLENRQEVGMTSLKVDSAPEVSTHSPAQICELWRLDLSYSERDAQTEQPCAFVYVKNAQTGSASTGSHKPVTAPCASINELDAEIRRLHAQLDEICLRAKKNFYKAYAAAAGA